jgi:hypothetical protein
MSAEGFDHLYEKPQNFAVKQVSVKFLRFFVQARRLTLLVFLGSHIISYTTNSSTPKDST